MIKPHFHLIKTTEVVLIINLSMKGGWNTVAKQVRQFTEFVTKLKYQVDNDFVCINDLIKHGYVYGLNPVIYNRSLSPEVNKISVYNHIYQRFRVSLNDDQLSYLCDHNLTSVEFIHRLKKML